MAIYFNKAKYKTGKIIQGCKVINTDVIDSIQCELITLEHIKTGSRIVQIHADDKNNLFNIFFPTYPTSSNGVAHILEHTTLCGSEKFPVRDSFFAMTKRSLSTFMNAMTAADFTCYPASSMVKKDYFNLLKIYLDAVFNPKLDYMSFRQEGHRLEFEEMTNPKSKLLYKGVVYNEMKGAMSNPSRMFMDVGSKALYPTTIYGVNSGGDPETIPDLSYENLKDFHKQFYNPTNGTFFFYGDIPVEENIGFILKNGLEKFSKVKKQPKLKKEKRFKSPKTIQSTYPVDQLTGKDSYAGIGWLTTDHKDPVTVLGLTILVSMLTDYDHSPLSLALIKSGLGVDLTGYAIDIESNEIPITFAAKGVDKKNIKKVYKVILKTLEDVAKNGFDQELIDSAFHAIEIQTKERQEPYGLNLSFFALTAMERGLDPKVFLDPGEGVKILQKKIKKGGYFEQLINKWLLKNNHRVCMSMVPDTNYRQKEEKAVQKKLLSIQKKLSNPAKKKIIEESVQLQKEQTLGDSQEEINKLPMLEIKDIRKAPLKVNVKKQKIKNVPFINSNSATNGLSYLKLEFDINDLTLEEHFKLPLIGNLLTSVGTEDLDYIELSKKINITSGRFYFYNSCIPELKNPNKCQPVLSLATSAIYRNTESLLSLIEEVLVKPDFSDKEKVLEVLQQTISYLSEKINPGGSSFAITHGTRYLSSANRLNSVWSGIEQLTFLKSFEKKIKLNFEKEMKSLIKIIKKVFKRDRLEIILSSQAKNINTYKKLLPNLIDALPLGKSVKKSPIKFKKKNVFEACQINTNVAYVGRTLSTVSYFHKDSPVLIVLSRILSSGFMHTEVREKGGAYGGNASFSPVTGHFSFISYRDPNIIKTYAIYDLAAESVINGNLTEENVTEGILQTFSSIDGPILPASEASIGHSQQKQGLTQKMRQEFRDRLKKVTLKDIKRVTKKYLLHPKVKSEMVVSGKELLKEANKELTRMKKKKFPIEVLTD
ncbi:MAG: hypothetical protein COA79_04260 [Planctomycetota bacterium]|nr:MAG: hypothetical protein COA79_04260 [Planctomycetota bacterium]